LNVGGADASAVDVAAIMNRNATTKTPYKSFLLRDLRDVVAFVLIFVASRQKM
jgi:hypothetical protein